MRSQTAHTGIQAMNNESNALMMWVMCSKDPTVRCAGQCDDPQCVTNANRKISVNFSCPNCPTHLAQIESLTREKDEIVNQAISTWRRDNELLRAELDAAKRAHTDMTNEVMRIGLRHLDSHQGDVYHIMQSLKVKFGAKWDGKLTEPADTARSRGETDKQGATP